MSINPVALLNRLTTRTKFRHIQVFVCLAELRSMGQTAKALGMTQPAVSQLIAELETLTQTVLFLRHSKGVDPTPASLELLPVARRIIAALEAGAELIASNAQRAGGYVRISATAAAMGAMVGQSLGGFARKRPEIHVEVRDHFDHESTSGRLEKDFDLVCRRRIVPLPNGWDFEECVADELLVVCHPTHPYAQKLKITLNDLGEAAWLPNPIGSLARRQFEDVSSQLGWQRSKDCKIVGQIPALTWSLLSEGVLLSLVPRSVMLPWLRRGLLVALDTDLTQPLEPIGFLWRPQFVGSAAQKLARHFKSFRYQ